MPQELKRWQKSECTLMMAMHVPAKHPYQIVSHSTVVLRWCATAL